MSLVKHPKRFRFWSVSLISILACGFSIWGIRELLFPPTNVCAIERTEDKALLDISQVYPIKNNIELIGHVGGKAQSVFVLGDTAFVKLGLELAAFDIQDPSNLKRIGYILIPGNLIHIDDKRRYAYIHSSGHSPGLWKVDVSDPVKMTATNVYNPKFLITSIRLLDEQTYITTRKCEYIYFFEGSIRTRCDDTLHIVDSNNPDSPPKCYQGFPSTARRTLASMVASELIAFQRTARQGNFIYAAEENDGLKVYDVSNPIKSVEVDSYSSTSEFTDIVVYESYALATSLECKNQETYYCLRAFDVENPTNPENLSELPHKPVIVTEFEPFVLLRDQFVQGKWPSGVEIVDMSLPNSGGAILAPAQLADVVNMIVIANRAYVTTNSNKFLILDMTNLESPLTITNYNLGVSNQLNYGISVVNKHVYIIVRDIGMRILDISDELNIIEVGVYRMDTIPVELTVKDHHAYIAEWDGTLEIVDVSDPVRPIRVSVYDAGDRINKIHIVKNHMFITTGNSGMQIIDISDPTSPYLVGSFVTGTFVTGVDVECPYIYVSDIDNGLFVLKSGLVSVEDCD
jgi:hypothetical protein